MIFDSHFTENEINAEENFLVKTKNGVSKTSRADIARYMLNALNDPKLNQKMVAVTSHPL